MFGGADRESDRNDNVLDDFWCFDIALKQWRSLSASTSNQGGPCGRTLVYFYKFFNCFYNF